MLKTRVATALVLGPLFLAAVWYFPPAWFWWLVGALVGVGAWEWCRLAGLNHIGARLAAAAAFLILTALLISRLPQEGLQWIGVFGLIVWSINLAWLSRRNFLERAGPVSVLIKLVVGVAVLIAGGAALGLIHQGRDGRELFLLFVVVIWAADIGAYAAGRLLGKHKLAPNISPGKTWEGVLGGQILVALVVVAAAQALPEKVELWSMLAWAAATAAVSVVGDLLISLLKRQRGVKDAGAVFPGHGGVLDRFDSMLAAAPVFGLGLILTQT